jgi:hypothetical protein
VKWRALVNRGATGKERTSGRHAQSSRPINLDANLATASLVTATPGQLRSVGERLHADLVLKL